MHVHVVNRVLMDVSLLLLFRVGPGWQLLVTSARTVTTATCPRGGYTHGVDTARGSMQYASSQKLHICCCQQVNKGGMNCVSSRAGCVGDLLGVVVCDSGKKFVLGTM